ncbi:hypothetical protein SDC9_125580 [bioreactor metagenome]|uniref:Uncharacterized protein n=1 Tax=bioreactor metagenome TaxID=1076179 RepID=A0A645CNU3_9ZZZZ
MNVATLDHANCPASARPIVTAGFRWAPDIGPAIITPVKTASPHPMVITIQPPLFPFVPLRTTLATTPFPRRISTIVPISSAKNSPIYFFFYFSGSTQLFALERAFRHPFISSSLLLFSIFLTNVLSIAFCPFISSRSFQKPVARPAR